MVKGNPDPLWAGFLNLTDPAICAGTTLEDYRATLVHG